MPDDFFKYDSCITINGELVRIWNEMVMAHLNLGPITTAKTKKPRIRITCPEGKDPVKYLTEI
jgi:hypothetical protein